VSLLSVSALAVPCAGAWWWITWPERTAQRFIELVNAEDLPRARQMITHKVTFDLMLRPRAQEEEHRGEPWKVDPMARSMLDILQGRQEFKKPKRSGPRVTGQVKTNYGWRTLVLFDPSGQIIVQRGSITIHWDFPDAGDIASIRSQSASLKEAHENGK
jgi:hypothetical protein